MSPESPSAKDMLEHAWRYFSLHAGQRLVLFNFFLVVSASLAAGLTACLQRGGLFLVLGIALGGLLALLSFVFWKLDRRTVFLIKHAEEALVELESVFSVSSARLVSREPARTAARERGFLLTRMWTYSVSFRILFALMGTIGVAGAVICWLKRLGWQN
jgi:hypothetical protein